MHLSLPSGNAANPQSDTGNIPLGKLLPSQRWVQCGDESWELTNGKTRCPGLRMILKELPTGAGTQWDGTSARYQLQQGNIREWLWFLSCILSDSQLLQRGATWSGPGISLGPEPPALTHAYGLTAACSVGSQHLHCRCGPCKLCDVCLTSFWERERKEGMASSSKCPPPGGRGSRKAGEASNYWTLEMLSRAAGCGIALLMPILSLHSLQTIGKISVAGKLITAHS